MASGVQVSDGCKDLYQKVKMKLSGKTKLNYAVFMISGDLTQIVPDPDRVCTPGAGGDTPAGEQPAEFTDLIANLPQDDGRYIVYDYPYKGSFGPTSKIVLVMWCPDNVSIKKKMLYASSKDALKKSFNDVGGEFQADCAEDLVHKDMEAKLSKV